MSDHDSAEAWQALVERHKRLAAVVLSRRYCDAMFDNFQVSTEAHAAALAAAKHFANNWFDDAGRGLWLLGPPGTGKTHLACAVLGHSIADDVEHGCDWTYAFVDWHDLVDLFRQWPKRDAAADLLAKVSLLVMDDLQACDERTALGLAWLVERRYRNRLSCILTANLTQQGIRDAVGNRTFDRLREGAVLRVLEGGSYRARFGWEGPPIDFEVPESRDDLRVRR